MCKSKADGGRRCDGHKKIARIEKAIDAYVDWDFEGGGEEPDFRLWIEKEDIEGQIKWKTKYNTVYIHRLFMEVDKEEHRNDRLEVLSDVARMCETRIDISDDMNTYEWQPKESYISPETLEFIYSQRDNDLYPYLSIVVANHPNISSELSKIIESDNNRERAMLMIKKGDANWVSSEFILDYLVTYQDMDREQLKDCPREWLIGLI